MESIRPIEHDLIRIENRQLYIGDSDHDTVKVYEQGFKASIYKFFGIASNVEVKSEGKTYVVHKKCLNNFVDRYKASSDEQLKNFAVTLEEKRDAIKESKNDKARQKVVSRQEKDELKAQKKEMNVQVRKERKEEKQQELLKAFFNGVDEKAKSDDEMKKVEQEAANRNLQVQQEAIFAAQQVKVIHEFKGFILAVEQKTEFFVHEVGIPINVFESVLNELKNEVPNRVLKGSSVEHEIEQRIQIKMNLLKPENKQDLPHLLEFRSALKGAWGKRADPENMFRYGGGRKV